MRGSTKNAPMLAGSRWRGEGDFDMVPGNNGPVRKGERQSSRFLTSSTITSRMVSSISATRRGPRLRQQYSYPSSKTRRVTSSVSGRVNVSDAGFFPVARDTYYQDHQAKATRSRPRGLTCGTPGSTAPHSNTGQGSRSPATHSPFVRELGYSSIVDLGEPTVRGSRRPRPKATRCACVCPRSTCFDDSPPDQARWDVCYTLRCFKSATLCGAFSVQLEPTGITQEG